MIRAMIAVLLLGLAGHFGSGGLSSVAQAQAAAPGAHRQAASGRTTCASPLKPLVVQVEFSDIPRKIESSFVRRHFLQEPDRYISEMSYGKTCLAGQVTQKWYRLPASIKQYWVPWQNRAKTLPIAVQSLVHESDVAKRPTVTIGKLQVY